MLSLPPSVRIFVCRERVDMRKAFDGLAAIARDVFLQDPMSGHLFVFFNGRRDRAKILWCDRSGFWLLCRRLESGTFAKLEACSEEKCLEMTSSELALLLDGIDLAGAKRRPTWREKLEKNRRKTA